MNRRTAPTTKTITSALHHKSLLFFWVHKRARELLFIATRPASKQLGMGEGVVGWLAWCSSGWIAGDSRQPASVQPVFQLYVVTGTLIVKIWIFIVIFSFNGLKWRDICKRIKINAILLTAATLVGGRKQPRMHPKIYRQSWINGTRCWIHP